MSPRFHLRPLSVQPDTRLVELAAEGDERAFETLVKRHRRSLAAYCRRIGLPEHRAEDVVQQSLTRAWVALSGGAEVREPRAWLYRIVHNTTMNAIRAERRHLHEPIEVAATAEALPGAGEIDAGLRARDALGHVAALPEQQRDALLLTAIEGRSHDEAANVMGLSDGAVRGLLYRARTNLRRAAAAFGPQGLLGWIGRGAGDGALAGRTAELSAGGAAAGAAGLLGKGAIATGVAALLAAGGTIVHLEGGSARGHRHVAAVSRAASAARGSTTARASAVADAQLPSGSAKPVVNRAVRRSSAGAAAPLQGGNGRRGSGSPYTGETNHGSHRRSSSEGARETRGEEPSEFTGASVVSSGPGGDGSTVYGGATQSSGDTPSESPLSYEKSSHMSDDPPSAKDEEGPEREEPASGGETTTPTEETQKRSDG